MSKFAMGCLQLGGHGVGEVDENEMINTVHCAIEQGIDLFDTAPIYGLGHSEELLGIALKGKRQSVNIATKVGLNWNTENGFKKYIDNSPESIRQSIEDSLKRLNTDYIDICFIHYPDVLNPIEDTLNELLKCKEEGKILNIGYCNLTVAELEKAKKITDIIVQVPYNLLERNIEKELLPYCKSNNVEIMVHTPLARGFLSGKYNSHTIFKDNDRRKNDSYLSNCKLDKVIALLKIIAYQYNMKPTQVALQWLARKSVNKIIFGVKNSEQLKCDMFSLHKQISEDDLLKLETI